MAMTHQGFVFRPRSAAEHHVRVAISVEVAQLALLVAACVSIAVGLVLFTSDRRLAAVIIAVWGVAAAVTVYPVLGYIGWRVQRGVEAEAGGSNDAGDVDQASHTDPGARAGRDIVITDHLSKGPG
jgi:hypothetical protein